MKKEKEEKDPKEEINAEFQVIPPKFRHPGLGASSSSLNGYSRFLEIALTQAKAAAARCAEQVGMDEEYEIFNKRALALEEELKRHLGKPDKSNE